MRIQLPPIIIDIEASGFGPESYPVEIGVALDHTQRYCALIKPPPHWTYWDNKAESTHQIPRDYLDKHGKPVREVAMELNRMLAGKTVYSDGWVVDLPWMIALYSAAGIEKTFHLSALEMILSESQMNAWHLTKKAVMHDLDVTRHRASNDAWIIQETYMRTHKLARRQPSVA